MKRSVQSFLKTTFILLSLGISVQVSAQPSFVTEVPVNSTDFVTIGDLVYFTSANSLWKTDGTAAGTILLKSDFTRTPNSLTEFNDMLIFTTTASELWRSDGTPSGTIQLMTTSSIGILESTPNFLFFTARDAATGQELYKTDGTPAGTQLIKDVFPGSGAGFRGRNAAVGNYLFFNGDDGTHGFELWKTDGTSGGTVMVKDILPGPGSGYGGNANAFAHNNLFYFSGNTVENGMEPWVSDGTAAGTILLQDTDSGADSPVFIEYGIGNGQTVYFMVFGPKSPEGSAHGPADLWRTNGTPASTSKVDALVDADDFSYDSFLVYQGKVYFFSIRDLSETSESVFSTLWVTDGTAEGTNRVFDLRTHYGRIQFFEVVDGFMLFYGTDEQGATCMIRSNGTNAGTELAFCFNANYQPYLPRHVTKINDLIFFGDHENGEMGNPDQPDDYYQLIQADAFTRASIRQIYGGSFVGTDNVTDYNGRALFTTYDDFSGSGDTKKRLWIYNPGSPVHGTFTLVNADTDEDIQGIDDGDVITVPDNVNITVRFNPSESPGSVGMRIQSLPQRIENEAPYSLTGDKSGDYNPWTGSDEVFSDLGVLANLYSERGGGGSLIGQSSINFTIVRESDACMASGTILREYWDNVSGNRVSDIPVGSPPTTTSQLGIFEGPTNSDTNYGARIRGYICPPASGDYTFWIASNDHSELWLSTDDDPAKKKMIAYITGATNPRQWDKFSTQKSQTIPLVAGQKYYIEALHKQGVGTDHVAVGWQLPGGSIERPIPGSRLSPADPSMNAHPVVTMTDPKRAQIFFAPADVPIAVDASDPDGIITNVEFFGGSSKIGEDAEAPYSFVWPDLEPGTYTVAAKAIDNAGAATTSSVSFTVVSRECLATGTITREYWSAIQGSRVSDIPVDSEPTATHEIGSLDVSDRGTNYAARIRGYLCPPFTGYYAFYISSNDHSELWLSTDNDPSKKLKRAYVFGATDPYEWDKYPSQQSALIHLLAGEQYYIEVLHKQGIGTDHLSVAWKRPDGIWEGPIRGDYLSPFNSNAGSASRMAASEETLLSRLEQISVYPNPAKSGDDQLSISGYEDLEQTVETQVEILNLTGEVVYAEKISCGGDCGSYLMNINKQLVPGVYLVNMKMEGLKLSKRLLVR